MAMKTRHEIDSLDYALSVLVSFLEHVFHGHGKPWRVRNGLNIEILEHIEIQGGPRYEEVRMLVRPIGWQKEEAIFVRCMMSDSGWWPFDGTVISSRLPKELNESFSFKFHGVSSRIPLECLGSQEEHFLKKVHPGWFAEQLA